MIKNRDFYAENERFRSIIAYYSHLLRYQGAEVDLWEFLWILITDKGRKPDAYIKKCIKNEYIRLSRIQAEKKIFRELNFDILDTSDISKSVENQIFIESAFERLSEKEKDVLRLHYALGFSLVEIARQRKTTRQAVNQMKCRALRKIKDFAELDKMWPK